MKRLFLLLALLACADSAADDTSAANTHNHCVLNVAMAIAEQAPG